MAVAEYSPGSSSSSNVFTNRYRHYQCLEHDSCGLYLLYATDASVEHLCWSLWLERDGIWFDNPRSNGAKYQYPLNFVGDEYKWNGDRTWRHVAFQLDSASDQANLYMDGRLAWQGEWGSAVREGDCGGEVGRKIAFGHSTPGWTYGAEVLLFCTCANA